MPQITLEYTANISRAIQPHELLGGIHEIVSRVAGLPIGNCKSRAVVIDAFRVGTGEPGGAFVHATVRILAGRPPGIKEELGRSVLSLLKQQLDAVRPDRDLQITVEVRDIERGTYFKDPPGTI